MGITSTEHWTKKGEDVDLFLFEKTGADVSRGTVLFVHGSSMASTPTFDLQVPERPWSSVMDWFCDKGFATWCVDMEGYGRSSKHRDINCDIANGADDLIAATDYITKTRGTERFMVYGISSGALRAAAFAERVGPSASKSSPSMPWYGPARAARRWSSAGKNCRNSSLSTAGRSIRAFVRTIFSRDHPGCAEERVVEAFAEAICALDDSIPNGTYVDMCSKLPLTDPGKLTMPVIVMRGQWDGIASMEDLLEFFARLPHPDKQFTVMPGISHASFQQKNYLMVYDILHAFFSREKPVYTG